MQGARGWCRWCCLAPGNEPHDSPLPNEKIRNLPEAVCLVCCRPLCCSPGRSFGSFDFFNFFNLDIFDCWCSFPENSATYSLPILACVLPLSSLGAWSFEMSSSIYDLVVIGSGPAGQKGAIAAAKAGKRVALVDRTVMMGGVCVHTGTIPSKTLREAIFQLTSSIVNALYGKPNGDISVQDLASRVSAIVSRETEVVRAQLKRNGVTVSQGCAVFLDPHTLEVQGDGEKTELRAERVLVACGTRPAHSPEIAFDNHRVVDTDHLSGLGRIPKDIIVV